MSTNETEDKHNGGQPRVLLPLATAPGSKPVVVIDAHGGHFNGVHANAPVQVVLVNWGEPFFGYPADDDDEPVEIDGKEAYLMEFSVGPDDGIDEKVARALNAAGIEMPGLPDTAAASKADLAKEDPADSKTTVASVSFAFQREYHARINLMMPENFTDDDLVAVLREINIQGEGKLGIFDDNVDHSYEWNVPSTIAVLGNETIEGDKATPEYVATRDGNEWVVEKVAAR